MDYTTTTKDNFPVVDITHRPKRQQGANFRTEDSPESNGESEDALSSYTIESAIQIFEHRVALDPKGTSSKLYFMTACWLRELLTIRGKAKKSDVVEAEVEAGIKEAVQEDLLDESTV